MSLRSMMMIYPIQEESGNPTLVPLSRAYVLPSGLKLTASVPGAILVLYCDLPLAMFHMRSMSSLDVLRASRPVGCTDKPVTSFLHSISTCHTAHLPDITLVPRQ